MSTNKGSENGLKTRQNFYISDQQIMMDLNGRTVLASNQRNQVPSLVIGGIPFHIVQQVSNSSLNSNDQNPPIYETIESDYSDMSSERGEMGSTTYQDFSSNEEAYLGASVPPLSSVQFVRPHSGQSLQSQATQSVSMAGRPGEDQRPKVQRRPSDNSRQPTIARQRYFLSYQDSSLQPGHKSEQHQPHSGPALQLADSNKTQMAQTEIILQSLPKTSLLTQL